MHGCLMVLVVSSIIISLFIASSNTLLCYRCDSQVEADCPFYPAPVSTYEDCDQKLPKPQARVMRTDDPPNQKEPEATQPLYIRYRYKYCPILERTVMQMVSLVSNPMDGVGYVCGKAITHGPYGVRIRRGCTPDLFLNGTNACVSYSPHGAADIACFCTTDLCNRGNSVYRENLITSTFYLVISVAVGRIIEKGL